MRQRVRWVSFLASCGVCVSLFVGCQTGPKRIEGLHCPKMSVKASAAFVVAVHREPELGFWIQRLNAVCEAME